MFGAGLVESQQGDERLVVTKAVVPAGLLEGARPVPAPPQAAGRERGEVSDAVADGFFVEWQIGSRAGGPASP
jgi:hypothetical protein